MIVEALTNNRDVAMETGGLGGDVGQSSVWGMHYDSVCGARSEENLVHGLILQVR